jgi:glycosyltransferase involved in cell wall biosynthesis
LIRSDIDQKYEHIILFYGVEKVPKEQMVLAKKLASKVFAIKKKYGIDFHGIKNVKDFIRNETPCFVILHINSLIYPCSRVSTKNLIFVEHQANHLKTKKEWVWSILAQRKARYIVCLTEKYQDELQKKLTLFFKKSKNTIIRTGINLDDFKPKVKENHIDKIKVGMISRINNLRDHSILIEAFLKIKSNDTELHIAGDGPLLIPLRNQYSSKKIIFYGNIPQTKIPAFLQRLNIYVHASLGETSSISIMQAQASGLPIIASDVNGINNHLNNRIAILVKSKSISELTKSLNTLILDKEKRAEFSKNSLKYASQNLSHIHMFYSYEKLLEQ